MDVFRATDEYKQVEYVFKQKICTLICVCINIFFGGYGCTNFMLFRVVSNISKFKGVIVRVALWHVTHVLASTTMQDLHAHGMDNNEQSHNWSMYNLLALQSAREVAYFACV